MEWTFIYIAGAVNCLFLSIVILNIKQGRKQANRILAFLIFLWSYGFFFTWIIETSLYKTLPHLLMTGASNTFLMGPALLFYFRTLTTPDFSFTRKHFLHALPWIVHLTYMVPFYMRDGLSKIDYWDNGRISDHVFYVFILLQLIHLSLYCFLTLKNLRHYRVALQETYSATEKINLMWLSNIITAFLAGIFFFTIAALVNTASDTGVYINRFSDIFNIFLVHIIGYRGLTQSEILRHDETGAEKYRKSSLTESDMNRILTALKDYLNSQKAYLDSGLTLQKLSGATGIPAHHISQALNQGEGVKFYEFINRFRVDHACETIKNSNDEKTTFLQIAFDSGFNSKSSFNALFREYLGMTPSQYKKQNS